MEWPADWPKYYNACNDPCDMLEGPCACGATHILGEFKFHRASGTAPAILLRDGLIVIEIAPSCWVGGTHANGEMQFLTSCGRAGDWDHNKYECIKCGYQCTVMEKNRGDAWKNYP